MTADQAALIQRAFSEASRLNAKAVIVEIDTFGGQLTRQAVRDKINRILYRQSLISKTGHGRQGALIAVSHKHIAIAPGEVSAQQNPIPTTEKTVAAVKAEFAATAKTKRGAIPG